MFESGLTDPRQRFLASVSAHGLEVGIRTPDDLVRHFSPKVLMDSLENEPDLRATILSETMGISLKVARRKPSSSAGDDLQIALEEGVTNAAAIVELFNADHRAKFLDASDLWTYITESEFWRQGNDRSGRAKEHMVFILERALAEELVTPRDVVERLTLGLLVHHLPEEVLEELLASVLRRARISEPFSEDEMLVVASSEILVAHVPMHEIWSRLIVPGLAERHDLVFDAARVKKRERQAALAASTPTGKHREVSVASGKRASSPPAARREVAVAPKPAEAAKPPVAVHPSASREDEKKSESRDSAPHVTQSAYDPIADRPVPDQTAVVAIERQPEGHDESSEDVSISVPAPAFEVSVEAQNEQVVEGESSSEDEEENTMVASRDLLARAVEMANATGDKQPARVPPPKPTFGIPRAGFAAVEAAVGGTKRRRTMPPRGR